MLPHTRDFTRDGCTVGARLVTYRQLEANYVCNACGGRIITKAQYDETGKSLYYAECSECGGSDFVSVRHLDQQYIDYPLIIRGLPQELQVLFETEPIRDISAEQAISELYDI